MIPTVISFCSTIQPRSHPAGLLTLKKRPARSDKAKTLQLQRWPHRRAHSQWQDHIWLAARMENFPSIAIPGAATRPVQKSDTVSLASLHHEKTGRTPVLPCATHSDDVLAFDKELPRLDGRWSYQIA